MTNPTTTRNCTICEEPYKPVRVRQVTRGSKKCCQANDVITRAAKIAAQPKEIRVFPDQICDSCKQPFTPSKSTQMTCATVECRNTRRCAVARANYKKNHPVCGHRPEKEPREPRAKAVKAPRQPRTATCTECPAEFQTILPGKKTCSTECSAARQKARWANRARTQITQTSRAKGVVRQEQAEAMPGLLIRQGELRVPVTPLLVAPPFEVTVGHDAVYSGPVIEHKRKDWTKHWC